MRAYPEVGETYGRYVVRRRIGRGGMGAVFEAQQDGSGRSVALKVLAPDLSDEDTFRRRFLHEAATLVSLDSPHVITLYDYGDVDGSLFIAMQLVPGRDLSQLLEDGALDPEEALSIAIQVAEALQDAHATGLIHRDVKPSNVLVRHIRDEPFAYLCDFGIAKSEQSPHTRTRGVIGTFEYMAPERHTGAEADQRSDVYSLGCLLWAALSGQAPYQGTSEVQVAMAHLQQPVPEIDPTLPAAPSLQEVLLRALAKDPAERYQSAAAMGAALREARDEVRRVRRNPASGRAAAEPTLLRTPAAGADPAPEPTLDVPRLRRRWSPVLASLAAVLVVIALAGAGFALVRHDRPAREPGAAARPAAARSATARRSTHPAQQAKPSTSRRPASSRPSTAPTGGVVSSPSTPPPSPSDAAPAKRLVCWDGATVADVADCSTPTGPDGMASVFPSFDNCPARPVRVDGKLEVYECQGDRVTIRYSRWTSDADRVHYLDRENPGAVKQPWVLGDDEVSGTTWLSYESPTTDPAEDMRYQWSATYAHAPFEVSVEGVDEADRRGGIAEVLAKPESQVGLQ